MTEHFMGEGELSMVSLELLLIKTCWT